MTKAKPSPNTTAPTLITSSTTSTATATAAGGGELPTTMSVRGADISSVLAEEKAGTKYSRNGVVLPLEHILASSGATYVRIRLWVNPTNGDSNQTTALAIARRAQAAGLKIFLDLQYSDWWADPTWQASPAAWTGQTLSTLVTTVRAYTSRVMSAFAAQGSPVSMVEIGNEINAGILWPTGKVGLDGSGNWSAFAQLLNGGIAGARAVNPAVKVVLHTALGSDNGAALAFYDRVIAAGVTDFDVIGLSYYPFWQNNLAALSTNLDSLAIRYDRPVLLVETSYPWTLSGTTSTSWVTSTLQLPDGQTYPPTTSGQVGYYAALRRVLQTVPNNRGLGFLVWEPGWLPGVAAVPGATTPAFANLTLFDYAGRALPALSAAFAS